MNVVCCNFGEPPSETIPLFEETPNTLMSDYGCRFREPADTNRPCGYWLFLAGSLVGVPGIIMVFMLGALSGDPPAWKPGYAVCRATTG